MKTAAGFEPPPVCGALPLSSTTETPKHKLLCTMSCGAPIAGF